MWHPMWHGNGWICRLEHVMWHFVAFCILSSGGVGAGGGGGGLTRHDGDGVVIQLGGGGGHGVGLEAVGLGHLALAAIDEEGGGEQADGATVLRRVPVGIGTDQGEAAAIKQLAAGGSEGGIQNKDSAAGAELGDDCAGGGCDFDD